MQIVDAVTDRWGVEEVPDDGKVVWLPWPPPESADAAGLGHSPNHHSALGSGAV
jgi:hypothetical protein